MKLLRRIDPADVVVEVFSIVLAILLALAANHWQEQVRTAHDVRTLVANVRDEIARNRALLVANSEHHTTVLHAFQALTTRERFVMLKDYFGTFSRADPTGFHPFQSESFAWDVMRTSPSIDAVRYDTRIVLERTYAAQNLLLTQNSQILIDLHASGTNRDPDYFAAALSMRLDLSDVVSTEYTLRGLYDTALRELPPS